MLLFWSLRRLRKNYSSMPKEELWSLIKEINGHPKLKKSSNKARKFARTLYKILLMFGEEGDIDSELAILNQIGILTRWAQEDEEIFDILSKTILAISVDSQGLKSFNRLKLFNRLIDLSTRFPKKEQIQASLPKAVLDLIRWGTDQEILMMLESMKKKATKSPMVPFVQKMTAEIYKTAFLYLYKVECQTLIQLFSEFFCYSFDEIKEDYTYRCPFINATNGEEMDEIVQEGIINAIINIARIYGRKEQSQKRCLEEIRKILSNAQEVLISSHQHPKKYDRLVRVLDQYDLWQEFHDLPIIQELKIQKQQSSISKNEDQAELMDLLQQLEETLD
ncbi:MAG: hypothetical protein GF308_12185 [Candidatus Heimdallarchaeota archaeon]|nr:hypothetical protein [Candidatus Heimdallarchaeota archaeon]